jgi:hypothetical protein
MVCKKNTSDLYRFGPKNALRTVGEGSLVLNCTEVRVVRVISGREREELPGLKMRVECVCDSTDALARSRRVICLCAAPFGTVPACSFYSLKEVQGYKMLAHGVILVGEGALRPREGLIRWRRGLHCGGVALVLLALLLHARACAPLLREWYLSFGVVATRPVIPDPMAGVAMACSSL